MSVWARRSVSAIASGWSAKRIAIACGVASTWAWLPRRSGSEASSVVCSRIATKASCRRARAGEWACTSPVATQGTFSRCASDTSPRFSVRSWRANGRCSSTRKASGPKAASSRRIVGSSLTPCRAHPERQTSPCACSSSASSGTLGFSTVRLPGVSRVCACARVRRRQRLRQPVSSRTSSVTCRSPSSVSSHPWIACRPNVRAACANSIDPEIVLWSVSASAVCPRSTAAITSSSGSDAPSRNENAECA